MKKKIFIVLLGVSVLLNVTLIGIKLLSNNDIDDGFNDLSQVKHEHMLSMMLEQNAGEGDYSLESRSSWPTKEDGYVFNPTLSKCEKGSKLRWDEENNAVVMVGTTSDKCYVYFDLIPLTTLANWVIEQYGVQTSGSETIYLHNSSLANGAGDNSYRYAGASDDVNNFVCFASEAATCPDDNLYRIIGVFGNQVKLIKWDYATTTFLGKDGHYAAPCSQVGSCFYDATSKGTNTKDQIGTFYWNYTKINTWNTSELNTVNLNANFLTNIGSTWASKIATTTWKVGGNTYQNIVEATASTAYTNEYVSPAANTIESKKIGLMYTSDYGFAASPSAWTINLEEYDSVINENWMYMGLLEWTVVPMLDTSYYAFEVESIGIVSSYYVSNPLCVRPVFYLNSNVTYVSGDGTKTSPIRIN